MDTAAWLFDEEVGAIGVRLFGERRINHPTTFCVFDDEPMSINAEIFGANVINLGHGHHPARVDHGENATRVVG